ncbi:uncharacterized protein LOC133861533 [Alnus glutinosa]|uniref:uncharacterized protein LOC133861533 n=1 Tax=Alnus glutinosa TaxID=3517 RepID=UPI002D78E130|nr:uncharacterized protein LOC133861533 [Alnus glutinosa]
MVTKNNQGFVDDLLIFPAAEMASLSTIKVVLAEFEDLSELKVNPAKSTFFYSGVHVEEKKDLLELLQMSEGVLPIKYSGVPLITKRLLAANYDSLIAKISTRMDSWLIRHLSFAGRLILITSVFDSKAKAKIAWDKKLLRLREVAKDFIWFKLGDGSQIFLWYDHWHPVRCLIDKFGFRAIYDAGSCLGARLSSTIRNGDRFWPCARSDNIVKIQINLPEIEIEGIGLHIWNSRSGDIKRCSFSRRIWRNLMASCLIYDLVWSGQMLQSGFGDPKTRVSTGQVGSDTDESSSIPSVEKKGALFEIVYKSLDESDQEV